MQIETETTDERTAMIRAATKACFAAHEPINVANISARLPEDFWIDELGGEPEDGLKFREIQATFAPKGKTMIETNPEGHKLAPVESFPDHLPPSERVAEPVAPPVETLAAPATKIEDGHVAVEPRQSGQARLDYLRQCEADLIAVRPSLVGAQREARSAVAENVRAYQEADPHRQSANDVAKEFRDTSQRERAARVARESGGGAARIAYVDAARKFSTGGDGNDFVRRQNVTGNKRGAMSLVNAMRVSGSGIIDKAGTATRGPVPAPEPIARPTVPALAK